LGSHADGFEDGGERAGAGEAFGIDDGADGGLALGRPHGPVAVGHLPLHDGRTKQPLGAVVKGHDAPGASARWRRLILSG
jgi:hypothetical protein